MISTTVSTASYTATAGQTVFAYPFRIQNQSDMLVFAEDTLGVRTNITASIVSVSGVDNEAGGNVTLPAQTLNTVIYLVRASTFTQLWDASALNFFDPATVERVIDKLTILMQEVKTDVGSCLRLDDGEAASVLDKDARKGSVLGFNLTTGNPEFTYIQSILDAAVASVAPSLAAAQAAQSLAEAAKAAAELAENHAELAEANAELAEVNAETAEANAISQAGASAGSAATASTQAGIATTQAGLATTNGAAQVALATAQVALATTQAANAAASASTALNARALQFKGGIAGASVPSTSSLAGDYYQITIAGTSQSKTWAVGDEAIYNGTSGSWTQITGYFAPITSAFVGYMPDGYTQSDGATSNRAPGGIYGPFDASNNPREYIAGAASLTIATVLTVPTSNPAATGFIYQYAPYIGANNTKFETYLNASGSLSIEAQSSSGNVRAYTHSSFRSTYSGQTGFLKIYVVQGTTNPVVTWNGLDISASFTPGTAGTAPVWLDASMVPTYRSVGLNWPSGPAPIVTPILGTTSAADDAFYMSTGKWPAWVVAGGSCGNIITSVSRNSDFSAGATDWSAPQSGGTATVTGGQLVISGGLLNPSLAWTFTSFNSVNSPATAVQVSFDFVAGTAGSTFYLSNGGDTISATITSSPGSRVIITSYLMRTNGPLRIFGSNGWTMDNITIERAGALSLPSIQPINVIDDVSGIGGNQGRVLGGTPVTDKTNWRISANTWTSGNQQILAGSILDSTKHIIDQVEQSTTGTPTTTIGSASAGAQYKASSALTAGINPTTLVTRKLASNDVWVNSNSTAVVRTTITGHIAT